MTHCFSSSFGCKALLLSVFLLLLPATAWPQKKLSKKQFVKDSLEIMRARLIRPQLRIDNRITFHKGQTLTMNGVDAGVLLKEKLRLTLGYYALNDHLSAYSSVIDGEEVQRLIKLNYGSINTEYYYMNTRFISLGLPLDFGFGYTELKYRKVSNRQLYGREAGFVFLIDFGLSAIYKPIRWIGVKGVVGYRKYLINPVKDMSFSGFFTSLGLVVDLREIIKDVSMYKLKKKYRRGNNLENAVDLITD